MPFKRMFWSGTSNQDIHVLRGNATPDLTTERLSVIDNNDTQMDVQNYLGSNNDVRFRFQPLFKGTLSGTVFSGQGISVDTTTGVATIDALPRPLPKNNFIIEATATNVADNTLLWTETIRIHIHTSVTAVALTPQTLTVRPSASTRTDPEHSGYKFTVRAVFDDGTVGDLTENHGVTWSPAEHVDDFFGLLIQPGDAPGNAFPITATLPAALGGGSATATLKIGTPWQDDPDIPTASIVVGGGWPGTTLPSKAPNILFLSDGYAAADEWPFEQLVMSIVHHLKTDRLVRPYDLLCTSMNFWRVFLPANARGISFRCEVYSYPSNGGLACWPVPAPQKASATGNYSVANLVYAVGLPVPKDGTKSVSDLRGDWGALVDGLPNDRVPDRAIETWKLFATRTFINELDNFPGMAYGKPPAANSRPGTPMLAAHPFRASRKNLSVFASLLKSVSGVQVGPGLNIGTLWQKESFRQNDFAYNQGDVIETNGNDFRVFICTTAGTSAAAEPNDYANALDGVAVTDGTATFTGLAFNNAPFLFLLSSFPGGRAVNYGSQGGYIALSTRSGTYDIPVTKAAAPAIGLTLNFSTVPQDVDVDTCRTAAHELGHSLFLGDEYVDFPSDYKSNQASLAPYLNLQTEADLQTNNAMDGTKIRWSWRRVRKAAVVSGPITDVPQNAFRVPVVPGHAWQFSKGDTVLLRQRAAGVPLAAAAAVVQSQALQVAVETSAAASNDYVVVAAAQGVQVSLADLQAYTPGSILFLPVKAPSSVFDANQYPYAEMVAKNVRDLITSKHAPLYREPAAEEKVQHPSLDGLTPSLPGRPFCFKEKPRIVGLYEGGATFARKIFHPTGTCMMRNDHEETGQFCAVCRYVMVDLVDPFQHFRIDLDYDDIYPLT
jgi:hypothetical protein